MTDFFSQQEKARRKTGLLIFLVILSVLGIIAAIYAVVCTVGVFFITDEFEDAITFEEIFLALFLSGRYLLPTAGVTILVTLVGALLKMHALAGDGVAVARALKGREVQPTTTEPREKQLLNVVEEMAIAAGIRVPHVFILDREKGLNAFAAGNSADGASVIVTAGLLETLSRDELQAVIGHEFSHILNGDMRQNIKLIGILAGIFSLVVIGLTLWRLIPWILSSSSDDSDKKNGNFALAVLLLAGGLCLVVIGSIGYFFGRIIQSAISRQREYLADASSAQFTRNPQALASALRCIGAAENGSRLAADSTEIAHLCFASPRRMLFATHPPLEERIRLLDPTFDGDFGKARKPRSPRTEPEPSRKGLSDLGFDGFHHSRGRAAIWGALLAGADGCGCETDIYSALHQPHASMAFLFVVTFAGTDASFLPRMREIALASPFRVHAEGAGCAPEALLDEWSKTISDWTPAQRRAGCELATAMLRPLPPASREGILRAIMAISDLDSFRTPFELALTSLLGRRLRDQQQEYRDVFVRPTLLHKEAVIVLTVLCAYAGDQAARDAAWQAAIEVYTPVKDLSPDGTGLEHAKELDAAFTALRHLPNTWKGRFMSACHAAIEQDGQINADEEDLLRAIEDAIRA